VNRPYYDVTDTVFIRCSVCGRQLLYTEAAIESHERRCNAPPGFQPDASKSGVNRIAPPPPRKGRAIGS